MAVDEKRGKMDIKKIVKEIVSSGWWTEEAPGHLAMCAYFMDCFPGIRNHIDLPYHSLNILMLEKGRMREETKEDEKNEIFKHIIKRTKKDHKFADKLLKKQRGYEKKLAEFCRKIDRTDLERSTNRQILSLYNKFYGIYVPFIEVAVIPEGGDPFAEHYLMPILKEKEGIKEGEINEVMSVFSRPSMYSFMDHEHADFLKLCISYLKGRKGVFEKNLKNHVKEYFWIRNNYSDVYYLDERYFMERVLDEVKGKDAEELQKGIESVKKEEEILRKRKAEFAGRYRLSEETRGIFRIYGVFGRMIDERKRRMLKTNHYIVKLLNEIRARHNVGYIDISYYTASEINGLLLEGKTIPREELKGRFECSAYITAYKEKFLVTGEDAGRIVEAFNSKIKKDTVKGIVANRADGNITGEVCIIIDPHKEKFPEGKILVTTMTRPDFIHLIKKAKAIITDEGGITCHAAIVSREFGIPCIIGTKNGTRALKTGDRVEIDTEKGIVSILR